MVLKAVIATRCINQPIDCRNYHLLSPVSTVSLAIITHGIANGTHWIQSKKQPDKFMEILQMFKMIIKKVTGMGRVSLNVIREYAASFRISDDEFTIRPMPPIPTTAGTCVVSPLSDLTPAEEAQIEAAEEILFNLAETGGCYELYQPTDRFL